jgi:hypothetical protein
MGKSRRAGEVSFVRKVSSVSLVSGLRPPSRSGRLEERGGPAIRNSFLHVVHDVAEGEAGGRIGEAERSAVSGEAERGRAPPITTPPLRYRFCRA